MKGIPFQYPVVYLDEDYPEDNAVTGHGNGSIKLLDISSEPYEAEVEACGYNFHLIFGRQVNGHFLCIPNWNLGCELGYLSDEDWNLNSLAGTDRIGYEEATAITRALTILDALIG